MALHQNVAFLGLHPTRFTLHALAHNGESDYFHLYLLALYQKIRLSLLHGELIRRHTHFYRNLSEARLLWEAFLRFRDHYYFTEVTYRPQGNKLYQRFRHGLRVPPLYGELTAEV